LEIATLRLFAVSPSEPELSELDSLSADVSMC